MSNTKQDMRIFELRFVDTVARRGLYKPRNPLLLLVSGGSDSVALAYLVARCFYAHAQNPCALLHINHCLRGNDSDNDQHFVEGLAQFLGIPLFVRTIDVACMARESKGNVEALAREARYGAAHEVLHDWCAKQGFNARTGRILVAHTQNDRAEGFLMKAIQGFGPGGLQSLDYERVQKDRIVRPLLDMSRDDLRGYLYALLEAGEAFRGDAGELWREDATNAHTEYLRVFVRHNIVPLCINRNPQFLTCLGRSLNLLAEEDSYMEDLTHAALEQHVRFLWREDTQTGKEYAQPSMYACEDLALAAEILPSITGEHKALIRRVVLQVLGKLLGRDARIEARSIEGIMDAFECIDSEAQAGEPRAQRLKPKSGYVCNIQGNLAVSSNKRGVLIEPMERFRARRKRRL